MAGLNKIMVIGNLGSDPEMRYTQTGEAMTRFSIATNRTFSGRDGQRREETEWFTVIAWRQLAERANQFLSKGRKVYVEGRLKSSSWEGQDGVTRHRNEIMANEIVFLDRAGGPGDDMDDRVGSSAGTDAEDLPF